MEKTFNYDTADFLRDEEDMRLYLESSIEDGDLRQILTALGDIARAHNMAKLARDAGISREGLYKGLSPQGNPSFDLVLKVMAALGFQFTIKPIERETRENEPKVARLSA